MSGILIRWLTATGAILLTAYLLSGIHVEGFLSAFLAAAMLGILNALFRPIALLITLPINVLTLGLFTFVINALMLKMASGVISGFDVHGFGSAILGSLMISVISWLLNSFVDKHATWLYNHLGHKSDPGDTARNDTIELKRKNGDHWE
ncbi:MAG: phage holin family protein [Desulfobacterales bacterium]|jgi:putative membrane protein